MTTEAVLRRAVRDVCGDARSEIAGRLKRNTRALQERLQFADSVIPFAVGVAFIGVQCEMAARVVLRTQEQREHGKGRRPSARAVERLQRRHGLLWNDYVAGLARLEDLAAASRQRTAGMSLRQLMTSHSEQSA
jgi:hypothetical protein